MTSERRWNARTERKRRAILDAAADLFLRQGFPGTNMDEIASLAHVSKQTVYAHFASKEAMFVTVVEMLCTGASDAVHGERPVFTAGDDVAAHLRDYARRQLEIVLTPRLMQLRRMVIGEGTRFPELGRALHDAGPGRAITAFAETLAAMNAAGVLAIADPQLAAEQFNWLIMGEPVNRAMLLGDAAIPDKAWLRQHADQGVRVFLAAYRPQ